MVEENNREIKVKTCPLHKEEMIAGDCIQYSHWHASYLDQKAYFSALKEKFPCANIIKWGSCARKSNIVRKKHFCISCRKELKTWWDKKGDMENFPKVIELLETIENKP